MTHQHAHSWVFHYSLSVAISHTPSLIIPFDPKVKMPIVSMLDGNNIFRYPIKISFTDTANLTFEYSRSFNPSSIAECLFQNSLAGKTKCGNVINVSGSTVPYRGERDWLADYFALPTDFQSTLQIDPFIDNFILDFNFFFGFDEFVPGLFFRVHVPVVHTRWSLRFQEHIQSWEQ